MRRIFGSGLREPMRRVRGKRRKMNLMMCSCPLRKRRRKMKMGRSRKGKKMGWRVKVKVRMMKIKARVMKLMNNRNLIVNKRMRSQVHNKLQKKLCTEIQTIELTVTNTVKMVSQHQDRQ